MSQRVDDRSLSAHATIGAVADGSSSTPGQLGGPALSHPGPGHTPSWAKATASGTGNCVEVRRVLDRVQVRDSKADRVVVEFTEQAWRDLVAAAKTGALDLECLPG